MADIVPPLRLTAFEYRGRLKGGRSRPMLVACRDEDGREHQVVLKLREVPVPGCSFGPASLACELICAMLARMAGLSVPDYAIVGVDDREGFIRNVPDPEAQRELSRNEGEDFGAAYLEDHARYVPNVFVDGAGKMRLEGVLALDAYVLNNDRKESNPNLLVRGDSIVLIDHSLGFPHLDSPGVAEPWNQWLPDESVREHCTYATLKGTGPKFAAFVGFLGNELTDNDCRGILDLVPDSWQRHGRRDKESILRYLLGRSEPFVAEGVTHLARVCGP
jgi:hypothetical protein